MYADGKMTAELGQLLELEISGPEIKVIYDHGDKQNENVGAISAYYDELRRDTKLAEIDIAILDKDDNVILLIEVEESDDRPKTIIGDAMTIFLSDGIAFKGETKKPNSDEIILLILFREPESGHEERNRKIEEKLNGLLSGEIINKLKIIRVKVAPCQTTENMKKKILEELGLV